MHFYVSEKINFKVLFALTRLFGQILVIFFYLNALTRLKFFKFSIIIIFKCISTCLRKNKIFLKFFGITVPPYEILKKELVENGILSIRQRSFP